MENELRRFGDLMGAGNTFTFRHAGGLVNAEGNHGFLELSNPRKRPVGLWRVGLLPWGRVALRASLRNLPSVEALRETHEMPERAA